MARIGPSKWTGPERKFRMMLVRREIAHECHPGIPSYPRRSADFRVGDTWVFIHGRFWHDPWHSTRKMSKYWRDKVKENSERDAETRAFLKQVGWQCVVIWDDQFTAKRMWQAEAIAEELGRRLSASLEAGRSFHRHTRG